MNDFEERRTHKMMTKDRVIRAIDRLLPPKIRMSTQFDIATAPRGTVARTGRHQGGK